MSWRLTLTAFMVWGEMEVNQLVRCVVTAMLIFTHMRAQRQKQEIFGNDGCQSLEKATHLIKGLKKCGCSPGKEKELKAQVATWVMKNPSILRKL